MRKLQGFNNPSFLPFDSLCPPPTQSPFPSWRSAHILRHSFLSNFSEAIVNYSLNLNPNWKLTTLQFPPHLIPCLDRLGCDVICEYSSKSFVFFPFDRFSWNSFVRGKRLRPKVASPHWMSYSKQKSEKILSKSLSDLLSNALVWLTNLAIFPMQPHQ